MEFITFFESYIYFLHFWLYCIIYCCEGFFFPCQLPFLNVEKCVKLKQGNFSIFAVTFTKLTVTVPNCVTQPKITYFVTFIYNIETYSSWDALLQCCWQFSTPFLKWYARGIVKITTQISMYGAQIVIIYMSKITVDIEMVLNSKAKENGK